MADSYDPWQRVTELNGLSLAEAAEAYARGGIPVFPIYPVVGTDSGPLCGCGDKACSTVGKHPITKWSRGNGSSDREHPATTDLDQVRRWWSRWPNAGIGMPTGTPSGIVVLDLDYREHENDDGTITVTDGADELLRWFQGIAYTQKRNDLPATAYQRTGSGGTHLMLADPGEVRSCAGWLPCVDIRGTGGMVVLPPSGHASGQPYQWTSEDGVSPAQCDNALTHALRNARGRSRSSSGSGGSNGSERHGSSPSFNYQEAELEGAAAGFRDEFFNTHAFCLRKEDMSWADALADMEARWRDAEQPVGNEYPWWRAKEKLERVWEGVEPDESAATESATHNQNGETVTSTDGNGENETEAWRSKVEDLATWRDSRTGGSGAEESSPRSAAVEESEDAVVHHFPQVRSLDYRLTHDGFSERLIKHLGGEILYIPGKGWHNWDGTHWVEDDSGNTLHMTKVLQQVLLDEMSNTTSVENQKKLDQAIDQVGSIHQRKAILETAQIDPRCKRTDKDLNSDPYQLVVKNGTVDLKTGTLRPSDPKDLNTRCADVTYDKDARCPRWVEHVRTITRTEDGEESPETVAYLQKWAGYTLTGLISEQTFAFLQGVPNSGKSVFVDALSYVMGSYAAVGSSKILTGGNNEHQTVLADLSGPRLVFINEVPKDRVNEHQLKQIIGDERITARRMRGDPFTFDAKFKLWLSGNDRPRVNDPSGGFWRRLRIIPFDLPFPAEKQVKDFQSILWREEGPGILNWALEGVQLYLNEGMEEPERAKTTRSEYQAGEDTKLQWADEAFDMQSKDNSTLIPTECLIQLYNRWCEQNGIKYTPDSNELSKHLSRLGFHRYVYKTSGKTGKVKAWTRDLKTGEWRYRPLNAWWCPPLVSEPPEDLKWQISGS